MNDRYMNNILFDIKGVVIDWWILNLTRVCDQQAKSIEHIPSLPRNKAGLLAFIIMGSATEPIHPRCPVTADVGEQMRAVLSKTGGKGLDTLFFPLLVTCTEGEEKPRFPAWGCTNSCYRPKDQGDKVVDISWRHSPRLSKAARVVRLGVFQLSLVGCLQECTLCMAASDCPRQFAMCNGRWPKPFLNAKMRNSLTYLEKINLINVEINLEGNRKGRLHAREGRNNMFSFSSMEWNGNVCSFLSVLLGSKLSLQPLQQNNTIVASLKKK